MVQTFPEEDRAFVQSCNDVVTAYIAHNTAIQQQEMSSKELFEATTGLNDNPNSKSAQAEYESLNEANNYNEDLVNKTLRMLNEKIDTLNDIVNDKLTELQNAASQEEQHKGPTEIIKTGITEDRVIGEKLTDLKNKFDEVYAKKSNTTVEDYNEVINLSKQVIDEFDTKETLSKEEANIRNLCDRLVALDETRQIINSATKELSAELARLDAETDVNKREEDNIKAIKEELDNNSEKIFDNHASTQEALRELGFETKEYVDGISYEEEAQQENAQQNDQDRQQ